MRQWWLFSRIRWLLKVMDWNNDDDDRYHLVDPVLILMLKKQEILRFTLSMTWWWWHGDDDIAMTTWWWWHGDDEMVMMMTWWWWHSDSDENNNCLGDAVAAFSSAGWLWLLSPSGNYMVALYCIILYDRFVYTRSTIYTCLGTI